MAYFLNEKSTTLGIAWVSDQQIQSYPLDVSLLTRQVNKFVEEIQNILYAKALGKRVGQESRRVTLLIIAKKECVSPKRLWLPSGELT